MGCQPGDCRLPFNLPQKLYSGTYVCVWEFTFMMEICEPVGRADDQRSEGLGLIPGPVTSYLNHTHCPSRIDCVRVSIQISFRWYKTNNFNLGSLRFQKLEKNVTQYQSKLLLFMSILTSLPLSHKNRFFFSVSAFCFAACFSVWMNAYWKIMAATFTCS